MKLNELNESVDSLGFPTRKSMLDDTTLPDGVYKGIRSGYDVTLENGVKFTSKRGVRGINCPTWFIVKHGKGDLWDRKDGETSPTGYIEP